MMGDFDRLKGTIYGQAIGDALGLGTEFMTDEDMAWKYPNGIRHFREIFQDRHRKRWKIGDWTDVGLFPKAVEEVVNGMMEIKN